MNLNFHCKKTWNSQYNFVRKKKYIYIFSHASGTKKKQMFSFPQNSFRNVVKDSAVCFFWKFITFSFFKWRWRSWLFEFYDQSVNILSAVKGFSAFFFFKRSVIKFCGNKFFAYLSEARARKKNISFRCY